ncbi:protein FAM151B [Alosa sapidissima]|uniref:protein FAM151B n=1 Tax=Alosa sapidissima TaxID=34773 RepID=UPI001C0A61B7|nr:protein FAM151B [Alosa sapidissima]
MRTVLRPRRLLIFPFILFAGGTIWITLHLKSDDLLLPTAATGAMSDHTLDYFLKKGQIEEKDAAVIQWYHAANSRSKFNEALKSSAHMIEADILLRGLEPIEPIMAHPPENDSDITLQEWLEEGTASGKGLKLDFKSLQAVAPSMVLLEQVRHELQAPVWINADILPGPGAKATPLEPQAFLDALGVGAQNAVLSLGWTTGWSPNTDNPGYSWEMVKKMDNVCKPLVQPVTFPVRASLMPQSFGPLQWLLQQSDRYSLTVWTSLSDTLVVEDLLPYRQNISKSRVYYDLLDSQIAQLKALPGFS